MRFNVPRIAKHRRKIPLNPPISKGETLNSSLYQREVGRDFQMAKQLQSLMFSPDEINSCQTKTDLMHTLIEVIYKIKLRIHDKPLRIITGVKNFLSS